MTNPLITRVRGEAELTADDLQALAQACHTTRGIQADAEISPQDGPTDCVHIVLEGWAARCALLADGRRHFPALLVPGDVCDLDGLMLKRLHTGVCALTDCTVAVVPHAQLEALMVQRPAVRDALWRLLSIQSAIAAEWSVGFGCRIGEERAAHLLCELNARLAAVGLSTDNAYAFPLTQAQLADVVGLSSVHMNRTVQSLRARQAVTWSRHRLIIHDHQALAQMSGFKADYLHIGDLSKIT